VIGTASVPIGSGALAASVDGSDVLVATAADGTVTEVDGLTGRRVRVFARLGRPTAVVLAPRPGFGLVRPRFAFVADARGAVDVLDLAGGRVVRRVPVPRPAALALVGQQLWVASARLRRLTVLDVTSPPLAHVAGRASVGLLPVSIAADPGGLGVDAASRAGRIVFVDGVTLAPRPFVRLRSAVGQLLTGDGDQLWAAGADGRVVAIAADGRVVRTTRVAPGSRLALVGAWLASFHGRTLRLLAPPHPRGSRLVLPDGIGAIAFAVT
jgi:DNA-binding beta-propeller fold protein YncE